jgi:hypothetical protein
MRRNAMEQMEALNSLSPVEQRSAFMNFAGAERPVLGELIREAQLKSAEDLRSALLWPHVNVSDAWTAAGAAMEPLELLYASWFLGGNEACDPEQASMIIERLERSNVPVSEWVRTLIHAAFSVDLDHGSALSGSM